MSQQHSALAAVGVLGLAGLAWAASRSAPHSASGPTGTVNGTIDCSSATGTAEGCPDTLRLELVDCDGCRVPVALDRSSQTATFSVVVHVGTWAFVGNGAAIFDENDHPLTVAVTAGGTATVRLAATPLALGTV